MSKHQETDVGFDDIQQTLETWEAAKNRMHLARLRVRAQVERAIKNGSVTKQTASKMFRMKFDNVNE